MPKPQKTKPCKTSSPATTPSRREFLGGTGAVVAGAAMAPVVLGAPVVVGTQNKSGSKTATVGEGEYTYECDHHWGELPAGAKYGGASHGVAIDSAGLIYITHHGTPDSIFVFDGDGKFVRSLGGLHVVGGQGKGHGIDIRNEGGEDFLYLSADHDSLNFAKMTTGGEVVWTKGRDEFKAYENAKRVFRPTNACFSPDGGYYLGDGYGSNLIHRYDKDDNFLGTFGGAGAEPGKFRTPHGQWMDDRDGTPKLVIADRANKRLQYMTLEGEHLSFVEGLLFPADIDIQGDLMVVPDLHARITLFDKQNNVVAQLGDDPEWRKQALANGFKLRGQPAKWRDGRFIHPHDACFDANGNIYVTEWVNTGRVTKLTKVS